MMDVKEDALVKECQRRWKRADLDKARHRPRMEDCYRLTLPWRTLQGSNQQELARLDDIFDSTGMTVVEDFAADMLNTFTPVKNQWVDMQPSATLDAGDQNQIRAALDNYRTVLFGEMQRSSLYQALQESYLDLAVGTMALVIQDRHPSEPIHCQAVPVPELWIDRGPWGETDGRFRRFRVRAMDVAVMWPGADVSRLPQGRRNDAEVEVLECLYRDWSDRGTEAWNYVLTCQNRVLLSDRFVGAGSCPIIVARWSRDSMTAWGVGPTYRALADLKTLNYVREKGLKNLDLAVDPVRAYDDDGVINVSAGVSPGDWIPRAPGSGIDTLEAGNDFQLEWMNVDDLRSQVRRAHYQDRPEQTGKTPPTATQWADEAAERARRMGTPATNLVLELQYPIVKRFAYLLARRGVLPAVRLGGQEIQLTPISPLLRAQEQEEVVRVTRWAQNLAATIGPEQAALVVDGKALADFTALRSGVPAGMVRTEQEIQQIMAAAQQAQQGAA